MRQTDTATENALIDRARKQDAEAFGRIVDLYQGRVLGFVRRMLRDPEEAYDVTQEVFIKAYQNFARFDGRSSLRTWLFRIAYNLCVDRARKADRRPVDFSLDNVDEGEESYEVADSRWSPETLTLDGELIDIVEDAIRSMSEKLRTVLLLHDREDMAYEEIAGMIGVPVGTVKSRLFLARGHIQKALTAYSGGTQ